MEQDDEFEILRLKKLLDEKIIQVEKENMVLLESSNEMKEKLPHPVKRNMNRCPHTKTSLPIKLNESEAESRDIHARIHFLNELQSTLSPAFNKRKMLIESSKNRYIPCAIPLSPPIRVKKDSDHENADSSVLLSPPIRLRREPPPESTNSAKDQNYIPNHNISQPSSTGLFIKNSEKSSPVHTCDKFLPNQNTCGKFLLNQNSERNSPVHTSGKFLFSSDNYKLSPVHTCNKSSERDFTLIEKDFPASSKINKNEGLLTFSSRKETNTKDVCPNKSFVYNDNASSNQTYCKTRFFPRESGISHEEPNTKPKTPESFSQGNEEKNGFNLHIALDSCSTKDVINTVLHKLPEVMDTFRNFSNDINSDHCTVLPQTSGSCYSNPEAHIFEKLKPTISVSTQTIPESSSVFASKKIFQEESGVMSSLTQTDQKKEELSINKHELNNLVKDIVLETLQNMQVSDHISSERHLSTCQKVDSGIQSEAESDVPDRRYLQILNKDNNLDQENHLCKSIQVDFNSSQTTQEKHVLDKGCNTENQSSLFPTDILSDSAGRSDIDLDSEIQKGNTSSPIQKSNNRIEMMLEKIYEHVCPEKEISRECNDVPLNSSFLTRDVAVQYNPLHTCSKSTLTSEIKKVDSSSQYDIEPKTELMQKSYVNASVQCTAEPCRKLQVNAHTQCEQKSFIDSVAQTELLANSEHSASNTSISSTPVSDSMFVDDFLSEGEIPLPWNLRLLSQSDGNMNLNNTDLSEISGKEKDYSLSEGEIPPNVVQYCMYYYNHNDGNDLHSEKVATDTAFQKPSSSDCGKAGQSTQHSKNLHLNTSSSSLSEGEYNSNSSLSLGEIPPGYRISFGNSSTKAENNLSARKANSSDCWPSVSLSQTSDLSVNSGYSEGEIVPGSINEHTDKGNASKTALHTVDEEVHSMVD